MEKVKDFYSFENYYFGKEKETERTVVFNFEKYMT